MDRSESKYFNTAEKIDRAFLDLLDKKDFEYITIKEICEHAGINRSTFYFHYETLGDLLSETMEYINRHFLQQMRADSESFIEKLGNCRLEDLYLVTPEYLIPYLYYIKENRRAFCTAVKNSALLRLNDSYSGLFRYVFTPILERLDVPAEERGYIMAFYINGLMAVISEWLKTDCADSVEHVASVMQKCVLAKK